MYVLFVVLNQQDHMHQVLKRLKDVGIYSATVIDSVGTGQLTKNLGREIPFIGGLMKNIDADMGNSKTMFTVVNSKPEAEKIMDEIEKVCGGDMRKPNTGIMFTIPIDMVRGGTISRKNTNTKYHGE